MMHTSTRLELTLLATRPWSFSMTAVSVTLGNLAGRPAAPPFHWGRYLLLLIGMILVHAATNLLNDYFDFRHGVDVPGAPTTVYRRHPLVAQDFSPAVLLGLSFGGYAAAALIGLYFIVTSGWIVALFAVLGGLISLFYTAGPVAYKYRGWGEAAVFVAWGPLMMLACHYIQTDGWAHSARVLGVSVPQGFWAALVLLADNAKDIAFDARLRVNTVAVRFGKTAAINLYRALVAGIYGVTLLYLVTGIVPVWALSTILAMPLARKLVRRFQRDPEIPPDAGPQTAQIGLVYGLALIIALLIDIIPKSP